MNITSIPKILRNRYVLTLIIFVVWILFFDSAGIPEWMGQKSENRAITKEIEQYTEKIKDIEQKTKALKNSNDTLEKYARENFYMKRDNEVIYIVE